MNGKKHSSRIERSISESYLRPRRRWNNFSIRGLLIAMLVVCILFAWIGNPFVRSRIERSVANHLRAHGGVVYYGYDYDHRFDKYSVTERFEDDPFFIPSENDLPDDEAVYVSKRIPGSKLVRAIFGDDIYSTVSEVFMRNTSWMDEDVAQLPKLVDLTMLTVGGPGITDTCIDDLLRIKKLLFLQLVDTNISPAGIARLAECNTLERLNLVGGGITDKHLAQLNLLPNLETLRIKSDSVTDAGMVSLGELPGLKNLDVALAKKVTDEGVFALSQLDQLEAFRITGNRLTDASAATIAEMASLKSLQLDDQTAFTKIGFEQLGSLANLTLLSLEDTNIGPSLPGLVNRLCKLKQLYIAGTKITDKEIAALDPKSLPDMEHVQIDWKISIGNREPTGIATFEKNFPGKLSFRPLMNPAKLPAITKGGPIVTVGGIPNATRARQNASKPSIRPANN